LYVTRGEMSKGAARICDNTLAVPYERAANGGADA
jgi:hypothetical protein